MKKFFFISILIMSGLLLNGCSSDKNKLISIMLPENPSTGYAWHFTFDKDSVLRLESDNYKSSETAQNVRGNWGVHTFNFEPVSKGEVTITFYYYRSNEKRRKPIAELSYQYRVDKKGIIEYVGTSGSLPDSMPNLSDIQKN